MQADSSKPPSGLIYGPDDIPPPSILVIAGLQHALAMFAGVTMVPLIISRASGFSSADATSLVGMAILVSGLSTLLQVGRLGPIGSGYLCVMGSSGLFIQPCVLAGRQGGPAMIFGMALAMAPLQALLSQATPLLRRLCPPAVVGSIITLIGMSIVPLSIMELGGGRGAEDFGTWRHLVVGCLTMTVSILAMLNRRPMVRVSAIILGLGAGYACSTPLGLIDVAPVAAAPFLHLPRPLWAGLSFDTALLIPFAVAYLVTSLETFGDMNTIIEISEGSLRQGDTRRIRGGLLADAVGSALAALFGTTPNTSYSGNIAMLKITGVASRRVGYVTAVALIVLSIFPRLSAVIVSMPSAVVGGSMMVAVAMLLGVGARIATRDATANRGLLIVGMAIAVGLGVQSVPELWNNAPMWLRPLLQTGTCMGALTAILLNLLLPRHHGSSQPPTSPSGDSQSPLTEAG